MTTRPRACGERGHALILSAIAVLFLALASTVIVRAATTGAVAATYELDQAQASLTAQAGIEWVVGTQKTSWTGVLTRGFPPNDGKHVVGSFTVEHPSAATRYVRSTGRRGSGQRVCVSEFTLFYVPGSRQASTGNDVVFEVYNLSGTVVALTGLSAALSQTAYAEEIKVQMFPTNAATPTDGVDYGVVWSYLVGGGGSRLASGQQATFNQTVTINNNRQALVQIRGFRATAGGGSSVSMDAADLRVVPREGAVDMAGMAVPRAQ